MKTAIEINPMGYEALMNALGFDGTIIFLRQARHDFALSITIQYKRSMAIACPAARAIDL